MSTDRSKRSPTCTRCGLLEQDCVCLDLQAVDPGLDIRLLIHVTEAFRQSNTGRMAHLLLRGSQIFDYGAKDQPLDESRLAPEGRTGFVLYPGPHAEIAGPETLAGMEAPYLIVLDGSWSQTRAMYQRNPALHGLRKLCLPPGPPPRWQQRRPPAPNHYCTLEALIHLLDALGKADLCPPLWDGLELVQARLARQRGRRK